MAELASELTNPGCSGGDDRDFPNELQELAAAKAALEVDRA